MRSLNFDDEALPQTKSSNMLYINCFYRFMSMPYNKCTKDHLLNKIGVTLRLTVVVIIFLCRILNFHQRLEWWFSAKQRSKLSHQLHNLKFLQEIQSFLSCSADFKMFSCKKPWERLLSEIYLFSIQTSVNDLCVSWILGHL